VVEASVIAELDSLESLRAEWDALAVSSGLPLMGPGWMLAWWRHIAPKDALLRAVEIRDGTELVGLAPFFVVPSRHGGQVVYRLAGSGLVEPLAPLSQPGRVQQVARGISQALSEADPRPDQIELQATPLTSRWHAAMSDGWPGRLRPISRVYRTLGHPTVSLQDVSFEAWLAGRSSNFRHSMRRLRSRFDDAGGTWRMSTESSLQGDVDTFLRLHAARWRGRGESTLVAYGERLRAMINDAGRKLIADERLRLLVSEIDGQAIGTDLYLCGGGIVTGVNGGWDEAWRRLSPPLLATMHMIEDSIKRGERRLDLGPGAQSHKTRFANGNSPVAWSVLMTPGPRLAQTFALTAPLLAASRARNLAKRVLTPEQVHSLRQLRSRAHW
jgi:CelD/BcsL family acetyltransferase involved in cellulose biosynthesis